MKINNRLLAEKLLNNKKLMDSILESKSLEDSYNLIMDENSDEISYDDYEKFMMEMYQIGQTSRHKMNENDLDKISGGSGNKFLNTCLSGLFVLTTVATPIADNISGAKAWGSSPVAFLSDERYLDRIPNKDLKNKSDVSASPVHEAITDAAYCLTNRTKDGKISSQLEVGSVWGGSSGETDSSGANKVKKGMYIDGYTGLGEELNHLLVSQMNCCTKKKCKETINASFYGRGNYLHCMRFIEGTGGDLSGQEKTYQFIMKWLENALVYAKYGINLNSIPDEYKSKVDPRSKIMFMEKNDIILSAKENFIGTSYEENLKIGISRFLQKNRGFIMPELSDDNIQYLSCCVLGGEYYLNQSHSMEVPDAIYKKAGKIIEKIKKFSAERQYSDEEYKSRVLGIICHTLEESFNPARCDRTITYEKDRQARLGGIKAFLYCRNQDISSLFDNIMDEELSFLKNVANSNGNEAMRIYEEQKGILKTLGLSESIEKVKEFLSTFFDETKTPKDVMRWISENVLNFEEKIAKSSYVPYSSEVPRLLIRGEEKPYKDCITVIGGRLSGNIYEILGFEELDRLKSSIEEMKKYAKERMEGNTLAVLRSTSTNYGAIMLYDTLCGLNYSMEEYIRRERIYILSKNYNEAARVVVFARKVLSKILMNLKELRTFIKDKRESAIVDNLEKKYKRLQTDYESTNVPVDPVYDSYIEELSSINVASSKYTSYFKNAVKSDKYLNGLNDYVFEEPTLKSAKLYDQYMNAVCDRLRLEDTGVDRSKDSCYQNLMLVEKSAKDLFFNDLENLKVKGRGVSKELLNIDVSTIRDEKLEYFNSLVDLNLTGLDTKKLNNAAILTCLNSFSNVKDKGERLNLLKNQEKRACFIANRKSDKKYKVAYEMAERMAKFLLQQAEKLRDPSHEIYCIDFDQEEEGLRKQVETVAKEDIDKLFKNNEASLRKKLWGKDSFSAQKEILNSLRSNFTDAGDEDITSELCSLKDSYENKFKIVQLAKWKYYTVKNDIKAQSAKKSYELIKTLMGLVSELSLTREDMNALEDFQKLKYEEKLSDSVFSRGLNKDSSDIDKAKYYVYYIEGLGLDDSAISKDLCFLSSLSDVANEIMSVNKAGNQRKNIDEDSLNLDKILENIKVERVVRREEGQSYNGESDLQKKKRLLLRLRCKGIRNMIKEHVEKNESDVGNKNSKNNNIGNLREIIEMLLIDGTDFNKNFAGEIIKTMVHQKNSFETKKLSDIIKEVEIENFDGEAFLGGIFRHSYLETDNKEDFREGLRILFDWSSVKSVDGDLGYYANMVLKQVFSNMLLCRGFDDVYDTLDYFKDKVSNEKIEDIAKFLGLDLIDIV